jgi:hypothetical protein
MASEVKYTAEQVATLVEGVAAGMSPEALAAELGKSVRSVIAKLSQMKLYKAKETSKAEGRVTKSQLVLAVEAKLGLNAGVLASLEKADKAALEALASAV